MNSLASRRLPSGVVTAVRRVFDSLSGERASTLGERASFDTGEEGGLFSERGAPTLAFEARLAAERVRGFSERASRCREEG